MNEPAPPQPYAESIVSFARDLIAIPTENPPGAAYDVCLERITAELDVLGLEHELVDTGDAEAPRRSVLARRVRKLVRGSSAGLAR
jgi:acetylornithine deacetylase/succinyl-diaminopimelate desuccinylase-like protein